MKRLSFRFPVSIRDFFFSPVRRLLASGRGWFFFLPPFLLLIETAIAKPGNQQTGMFLGLMFREQPGMTFLLLATGVFRALLVYTSLTMAAEVFFSTLPARVKRYLYYPYIRPLLFVSGYGAAVGVLRIEHPALGELFDANYAGEILTFSLVPALVLVWRSLRQSREYVPAFRSRLALSLVVPIGALVLTAPEQSVVRSAGAPKRDSKEKPSFLLVGVDGVPGDLVGGETGHDPIPGLRKLMGGREIAFRNAYTVTNSTYTSWFSILSGRYPPSSGVELLFPARRGGNVSSDDLLPNRLRASGYRTAFATDCSTTSTMEPVFGFDELRQTGVGFMGCGRSLSVSRHPLTALTSAAAIPNFLLPELDGFCSRFYRPDVFFDAVRSQAVRIAHGDSPFFFAVHSCLTHNLMNHAEAKAGNVPHGHRDRLLATVGRMDGYAVDLIRAVRAARPDTWVVFLADHGVRIDEATHGETTFSHATGLPINRFQYNVPLIVLPPEGAPAPRFVARDALVALPDLYPTILALANTEVPPHDGRTLFASPGPAGTRGLPLTSAVPISHERRDELLDLFWELEMDAKGINRFPEEREREILSKRPVGYLKLPYRLVLDRERAPGLFHELEDPHFTRDVSGEKPGIAARLRAELCRDYPGPYCSPERTLSSRP